MKIKAIMAGVALTASFGANAAWDTGFGGPGSAAGELVLSVWNVSTNKSFTQDLGVRTIDAMDGSLAAQGFALDAAGLAHVAGDAADIRFNVVGANSNAAAGGTPRLDHLGYYMTGSNVPTGGYNVAQINAQFVFFNDYSLALGTADAGTADNPVFLLEGATTNAGSGAVWGDQARGLTLLPYIGVATTSAVAGQELSAYSVAFDPAGGNSFTNLIGTDVNTWNLNLDAGLVEYQAVPVPAAVWFFASALAGLAGIARRRGAAK